MRQLAPLTASYTSINYVFYLLANWAFLYLVQERKFSVAESGWLASLPPLAAALGACLGGGITERRRRKIGLRWGHRLVPLLSLPTIAILLVLAVYVPSPSIAVLGMTLCFGLVELNEGAYWAATMRLAGDDDRHRDSQYGGAVGGLIGIPIVAFLSGRGAWTGAFLIGAACATMSAVAWLGVSVTSREATTV